MDAKMKRFELMFAGIVFAAVLLTGGYFIPWEHAWWGSLRVGEAERVTVVGEAKSEQKTQIATFTAGVSSVQDDKETAVADVNRKIQAITAAVKAFGIPAADIKTQNLNVYQNEEQYWEDNRQKMRPGQWRVNNEVQIKLRAVDRANDLADLLTQSGATNIYGPNFTLDDTKAAEDALVADAIKDALAKATRMARASGRNVGKIITLTEGTVSSSNVPFYRMEGGGGGGADLQPGTGTVTKAITVTFELR